MGTRKTRSALTTGRQRMFTSPNPNRTSPAADRAIPKRRARPDALDVTIHPSAAEWTSPAPRLRSRIMLTGQNVVSTLLSR